MADHKRLVNASLHHYIITNHKAMLQYNGMAELEASNYLQQGGSLNDESMERHWRESNNGMFSLSDFMEAVYRQAGND